MNKAILIGRLTRDPEVRYTQSGVAVCTFTLAVDRRFARRDANDGQPTADFIPVVVYKKQAENLAKYQSKGSQIGVVGRIQVRPYEKNGEKRTWTEVVVHEVEFLGSKQQERTVAEVRYEKKQQDPGSYWMNGGDFSSNINISDEMLPF